MAHEIDLERILQSARRMTREERAIVDVAHSEGLGDRMREWRAAKGLSLRAAAEGLGIPYSILQKIETGGRARTPDVDFLERVALVYSVPTADVLRAAGYAVREIRDARDAIDDAFRELVLDPRLRPTGMTPAWLDSFSTKQKGQWLEFAYKMFQVSCDEDLNPVDPAVVRLVRGKEGK